MAKTEQTQKRRILIRNLIIRVMLVLVFAWVVLLTIENLVIPAMSNQYISVEHGEQVLSNVGLSFLVSEEFEVPLDMQVLQSLRQQYSESGVRVLLHGAVLSGVDLDDTAEQVCLTKLWVVEPLPIPEDSPAMSRSADLTNFLNQIPAESKHSVEFEDFCVERGKIRTRSIGDDESFVGVLPFATGISPYFYPFDTRSLDLEIWVETEIVYEDETRKVSIVAPNVSSQYNLSDWELHIFKEQVTPENRAHPITKSQLTMQRTFASRLLSTTLLLSLFIIIFLLGFTRQIDAFIQASVAVLLTLLGIQDLLIPATNLETTIVDQTILGLYILFALVVLSRLTIRPIWERTRISELDDTDDRKTGT